MSVRALARKAATNLNIRWNKRTYVFDLVEGDAPVLALNLEDRAASEIVQSAPQVTPIQLLALLDKAKPFQLLKKQQPDAVAGAEARTFGDEPQITDFNDYEIRIEEVFRFNVEDTLVFHVTLRNKSERDIRYLPESFGVRVGNPLVIEKAQVDAELIRLTRLRSAHAEEQYCIRTNLRRSHEDSETFTMRLDNLRQDITTRQDTSGDNFRIELDGQALDNRGIAGELIVRRAEKLKNRFGDDVRIGRFASELQ